MHHVWDESLSVRMSRSIMQNRKNCYNVDNRHSGQQSSESHMIADLVRKLQNLWRLGHSGWPIVNIWSNYAQGISMNNSVDLFHNSGNNCIQNKHTQTSVYAVAYTAPVETHPSKSRLSNACPKSANPVLLFAHDPFIWLCNSLSAFCAPEDMIMCFKFPSSLITVVV